MVYNKQILLYKIVIFNTNLCYIKLNFKPNSIFFSFYNNKSNLSYFINEKLHINITNYLKKFIGIIFRYKIALIHYFQVSPWRKDQT